MVKALSVIGKGEAEEKKEEALQMAIKVLVGEMEGGLLMVVVEEMEEGLLVVEEGLLVVVEEGLLVVEVEEM